MESTNDLRERVLRFQEDILQRGALESGAELNAAVPSRRAFQLAQNQLIAILRCKQIDLSLISSYRNAVDALGERDLTDHGSHKKPGDIPLIRQSYADERELFRRHFPESEFHSLYER